MGQQPHESRYLSAVTRRTVLVAAGSGVGGLAGCIDTPAGGSGPERREFALTISRSGDALEMRIDPAGDVEDVIRIFVGDTVRFDIANETDVPVGVHNHATDVEIVLDAGGQRTMAFEATEAMIGRHEIEGWVADDEHGDGEDDGEGDGEQDDGGHGSGTTSLAVLEVRPRGS